MPVLKRKVNGVWVDVSGISSHAHNISDILDFPTSIPADGGNADTLGGKSADEFAAASDVEELRELIENIPTAERIEVDSTLSQEGKAADAKAVGDALAEKQPIGNYVKTINNRAPDENGNINVEGAGIDENIALITVEDIDEICGAVIQIATNDEVKF